VTVLTAGTSEMMRIEVLAFWCRVLVRFLGGPSSSARQSRSFNDRYASAVVAHEMVPAGGHSEIALLAVTALFFRLLRNVHPSPLLRILIASAASQLVLRKQLP
jgi:hypothetical protein